VAIARAHAMDSITVEQVASLVWKTLEDSRP
jgi:hypothetical protein